MSENRLPDYLDHIQQAATDARSFVEGMAKDDFLADKRTQQAVIMSLIVIGEAATKVMDGYVEFTQAHADVPWRSMRNMRNRMAHGYFDINLDVVWETVQEWLPALLQQLPAVRQDADDAFELELLVHGALVALEHIGGFGMRLGKGVVHAALGVWRTHHEKVPGLHEAHRGRVVRGGEDAAEHLIRHRRGQKLPAHVAA